MRSWPSQVKAPVRKTGIAGSTPAERSEVIEDTRWWVLDKPETPATCARCGWSGIIKDTDLKAAGPHIRANCPNCSTFITFAKKRADWDEFIKNVPAPNGGHLIRLKYDTVCRSCATSLNAGDLVWFFPECGKGQRFAHQEGKHHWRNVPLAGTKVRLVTGQR